MPFIPFGWQRKPLHLCLRQNLAISVKFAMHVNSVTIIYSSSLKNRQLLIEHTLLHYSFFLNPYHLIPREQGITKFGVWCLHGNTLSPHTSVVYTRGLHFTYTHNTDVRQPGPLQGGKQNSEHSERSYILVILKKLVPLAPLRHCTIIICNSHGLYYSRKIKMKCQGPKMSHIRCLHAQLLSKSTWSGFFSWGMGEFAHPWMFYPNLEMNVAACAII